MTAVTSGPRFCGLRAGGLDVGGLGAGGLGAGALGGDAGCTAGASVLCDMASSSKTNSRSL
jgi:hypothetical protein